MDIGSFILSFYIAAVAVWGISLAIGLANWMYTFGGRRGD